MGDCPMKKNLGVKKTSVSDTKLLQLKSYQRLR